MSTPEPPPMPDSLSETRVALKRVTWVVSELIDTEITYLESLRDLKDGYYLSLLAEGKFDATTLQTIFCNIVQLHAFHLILSRELSQNRENLVALADVFLEHAVDFEELYVDFCTKHSLSTQRLQQESYLKTDLWASILACQSRLGHLLPLTSYLLKPVQRVLKYQLLLQELVKGCALAGHGHDQGNRSRDTFSAVEHLQRALERVIQMATHINEAKRRQELIGQLQASGLDVDQWGRLLLRDVFRLPAKKHSCRLVLLFERAILLAKKFTYEGNNSAPNLTEFQSPSGEGLQSVLEIRDIISCNNLMLIECIDYDSLAFHILPFNNPNAQKTLQAANEEVKQLWCREIKRVILENFDAAIPEKAKHLMLKMEDVRQTRSNLNKEVEAEQAPRRKGSSVLTAIFKRRGRNFTKLKPSLSVAKLNPTSDHNGDGNKADGDEADHVTLVQDAWNALMAKHSFATATPTTTTSAALEERQEIKDEFDEDDFRCIAVDINEERFAVDLAPPQKLIELKSTSPPKGWKNCSALTSTGASIYIECREASQYDTVTFGRAYEQYIAKTRSMATLSPGEVDEILRPLLTLTEERCHHLTLSANDEPVGRNSDFTAHLTPLLASSEDCSGVSSIASSSSSMSACQLVSRIAIDSLNGKEDDDVGQCSNPTKPAQRSPHLSGEVVIQPTTATLAIPDEIAPISQVSKCIASLPITSNQLSKPPRTLPSSIALSTGTTRFGNETAIRLPSRVNGATASSMSLGQKANTNHGNEEIITHFKGSCCSTVPNLWPPEVHGVPKTTDAIPPRPSKPPRERRTKEGNCDGTSFQIPTPHTSASGIPEVDRGQGHVRHLISHFRSS